MKTSIPTTGIFVSYHRDDSVLAEEVASGLAEYGFDVIWDKLIEPGDRWEGWLKHEIRRARVVIICATLRSIKSDSVKYEIQLAKESGKRPLFLLFNAMKLGDMPWGTAEDQLLELPEASERIRQHEGWLRLIQTMENRLRPLWITQRIATIEESLDFETKRRLAADASNAAREVLLARDAAERSTIIQTHNTAVANLLQAVASLEAVTKERDAAKRDLKALADLEHEQRTLKDDLGRQAGDNARLTMSLEASRSARQALETEVQKLKDLIALVDPAVIASLASKDISSADPTLRPRVAGEFGGLRYLPAPAPLAGTRMIRVEPGTVEIKCYPKVKPGMSAAPVDLKNQIERPFEIGENLVTRRDWAILLGKQVSPGREDEPETNVSFEDATMFLQRLNSKAGGGFYMLSEQDWLFAVVNVTAKHNLTFASPTGGVPHQEWLFAEWKEYTNIVDGPASLNMAAVKGNMTRHDLLSSDAPAVMFQRKFWPSAMRTDQIGFRIARRL